MNSTKIWSNSDTAGLRRLGTSNIDREAEFPLVRRFFAMAHPDNPTDCS